MKISGLIAALQTLQAQQGDMDVMTIIPDDLYGSAFKQIDIKIIYDSQDQSTCWFENVDNYILKRYHKIVLIK